MVHVRRSEAGELHRRAGRAHAHDLMIHTFQNEIVFIRDAVPAKSGAAMVVNRSGLVDICQLLLLPYRVGTVVGADRWHDSAHNWRKSSGEVD